jgi:hypothetical protein
VVKDRVTPKLLCAAALASAVSVAGAAAADNSVAVFELNGDYCATWTQARQKSDSVTKAQFEAWVLGFLSGANWAAARGGTDYLAGRDTTSLLEAVDKACAENPTETIGDAARDIMMAVMKQQKA